MFLMIMFVLNENRGNQEERVNNIANIINRVFAGKT